MNIQNSTLERNGYVYNIVSSEDAKAEIKTGLIYFMIDYEDPEMVVTISDYHKAVQFSNNSQGIFLHLKELNVHPIKQNKMNKNKTLQSQKRSKRKAQVSKNLIATLRVSEARYIDIFAYKHEIEFHGWDHRKSNENIALFEGGSLSIHFGDIRYDLELEIEPSLFFMWLKAGGKISYPKYVNKMKRNIL